MFFLSAAYFLPICLCVMTASTGVRKGNNFCKYFQGKAGGSQSRSAGERVSGEIHSAGQVIQVGGANSEIATDFSNLHKQSSQDTESTGILIKTSIRIVIHAYYTFEMNNMYN